MSLFSHRVPAFLSVTTPEERLPLLEAHFSETWRYFQSFVRMLVRRTLAHTSLHAAERYARAHGHAGRFAGVGAVRGALLSDGMLVEDVAQDVGVLFLVHIREGLSASTQMRRDLSSPT